MKKLTGLMILFFSLCIAMPAKAQSAGGELLKIKSKEAREKIKEVTQNKAAAKKKTENVKTVGTTSRKWGAAATSATTDKTNTKGQVIIPVHPTPFVNTQKRYVPVDTSQYNPW